MDKIFTLLSRQMKSWWSIFIIYVNICTVFQEKFHDLHIAFKTEQNRILIDFPWISEVIHWIYHSVQLNAAASIHCTS